MIGEVPGLSLVSDFSTEGISTANVMGPDVLAHHEQ